MIQGITLFKIFIASPSGLEEERQIIRNIIKDRSSILLKEKIIIEAVGWEDVPPNNGRPQEIINEYINNCDYAILLWHDKWGSPSGEYSSGTEEELYKIRKLHNEEKIKRFSIIFKNIDDDLKSSNEDVKKISDLKEELIKEKLDLLGNFSTKKDLEYLIKGILENWFYINKEIEENSLIYRIENKEFLKRLLKEIDKSIEEISPKFLIYLEDIENIYKEDSPIYADAIALARRAINLATKDDERLYALYVLGTAQFDNKSYDEALDTYKKVSQNLKNSIELQKQTFYLRSIQRIAFILSMKNKNSEELDIINEGLKHFPQKLSDELIGIKTDFFNRKGTLYSAAGDENKALEQFDNAIKCIENLDESKDNTMSRHYRIYAYLEKGETLSVLGRCDKASTLYENILYKFNHISDENIKKIQQDNEMPRLLFKIGYNLLRKGDHNEALKTFYSIVNDYCSSKDKLIQFKVAQSYTFIETIYKEMNNFSKVIETHKKFIQKFKEQNFPFPEEPFINSYKNSAKCYFRLSEEYLHDGDRDKFLEINEDFNKNFLVPSLNVNDEIQAGMLYFESFSLYLAGKEEESIKKMAIITRKFNFNTTKDQQAINFYFKALNFLGKRNHSEPIEIVLPPEIWGTKKE